MVSSDWDRVSLGDVCRVEAGAGFPIVHQGLKDQEFPFFKVGDMNTAGNEKEMHVFQHSISEEIRKKLRAIAFPAGTIVFPKIGAAIATNKKRMIVKPSCVDNNVMALIPSENLDSGFLFYLLLNKDLSDFANTGNPPSIRQSNVEEWAIPLPPLTEQKRIASLLARADRLRALRRRAHDLSASVLQSVFLEMFGDFSHIPDTFTIATFDEIVKSTKLGLVRGAGEMNASHPFAYVRMDAILGDGTLDLSDLKRVQATEKEIAEFSLSRGDFLFNTRNSKELVGKTALFNSDGLYLFNNNIMRIRFNENIKPEYITYLFQSHWMQQKLELIKSGTTSVFAIYYKDLSEIPVIIPPLNLQEEFAGVVARVESLRERMSEGERQVEGLFESLLAESFS